MDDELVQKWRSGDVGAEATVRDHIRSIVAGVYSRPALFRALGPDSSLEFREAPTRSLLAEKTTREIMGIAEGGARQLEAAALMHAISHAIERLQALPERQRQSHLPPRVLCASVLSPAGLGRAMREAADRHLATCPHCRKDWELVRTIARETVQDVELGGEPKWADRVEPELRGTVAPAEERSSEPGAKLDFRGDGGTDAGRRFFTVWLMVAVSIVAVWLVMTRVVPVDPDDLEGVARLADLTPPPISRLSELPAETQVALRELSQGQCDRAALRLYELRQTYPDEARLYLLEGASFVCAADGRRALVSFSDLEEAVDQRGLRRPRQVPWYRAQAHLLEGDVARALESLAEVQRVDARHRLYARRLAREIEATQTR